MPARQIVSGKEVRVYVGTPSELGRLATVEFVIQQRDTAGGPRRKFSGAVGWILLYG